MCETSFTLRMMGKYQSIGILIFLHFLLHAKIVCHPNTCINPFSVIPLGGMLGVGLLRYNEMLEQMVLKCSHF